MRSRVRTPARPLLLPLGACFCFTSPVRLEPLPARQATALFVCFILRLGPAMSGGPAPAPAPAAVREGEGEGWLAYHQVRMNQGPLNPSTDGSTIAMDDLISCDTRSSHGSVFSYRSDRDVNNFIREVNGRRFNNHNITYFLPSGTSP